MTVSVETMNMVSFLFLSNQVVTLLCIVQGALSYVPVHERPVTLDRTQLNPPDAPEDMTGVVNPRLRSGVSRRVQRPPDSPLRMPFVMPSHLRGVSRTLTSLEAGQSDLKTKYDQLNAQISSLLGQSRGMSPLSSLRSWRSSNLELEARVSRLESENNELRGCLDRFEQFFTRLMSAEPASYDPNLAPDQRLSRLHQYLGNAEAELINIRSPTISLQATGEDEPALDGGDDAATPGDTPQTVGILGMAVATRPDLNPIDVNLARNGAQSSKPKSPSREEGGVHLTNSEANQLAAALEQISTQNTEFTTRLQTLEQKAKGSVIGARTFSTSSQESRVSLTNQLIDKVDRLEQVVALQASTILDTNPMASMAVVESEITTRRLPSRQSLGGNRGGRPPPLNQEDIVIMQGVLEEARSGSSRKSAFSVARTRPLIGTNHLQRIEFDHVYVNKGRDFDEDNSTFICERPGFYFVTFHLRSYDNLYLGVMLMKNSEVITAVYTDAGTRNVMEGQSVIVHLEPGDSLSLLLGPSEQFGLHSGHHKYVTFSGFLIYGGY